MKTMTATRPTYTTDSPTAHDYLRVSIDNSGRERSTEEQLDDNDRARQIHGWRPGRCYLEEPGSASRYAKKPRQEFAKLMADLETGEVFRRGDILTIWESSRGSRRVSEWARLMELCEWRGVNIYVTSHDHLYDLTNHRDRRSLQEDAVDGEYESGKTSARVRRAMEANARRGQPHGKTLFGYEREYDPRTKAFLRQVPKPGEAETVIGIINDLGRGVSLRQITEGLNARGILSPRGVRWNSTQVKLTALKVSYIGKRQHDPSKGKDPEALTIHEACWPPISDDPSLPEEERERVNTEFIATFHRVHARLSDATRKTGRPGKAKHLLSMIAKCGVCGRGDIVARTARHTGAPVYGCRSGCTYINEQALDAWVEVEVLARLAQAEVWARLTAGEADDVELIAARANLATLQADLQDLYARAARWPEEGSLSAGALAALEPAKLRALEAARKRVEELAVPTSLQGLLDGPGDLEARWEAAPITARREVIRLMCDVRVFPSPQRARTTPIEKRVTLTWR